MKLVLVSFFFIILILFNMRTIIHDIEDLDLKIFNNQDKIGKYVKVKVTNKLPL